MQNTTSIENNQTNPEITFNQNSMIYCYVLRIVHGSIIGQVVDTDIEVTVGRFPAPTLSPKNHPTGTKKATKPDIKLSAEQWEKWRKNSKKIGGSFTKSSYPPISDVWMSAVNIGDEIKITIVKNGIIDGKRAKIFSSESPILPYSEDCGISVRCKNLLTQVEYNGFLSDEPFTVRTIDVVYLVNIRGKWYIRIVKRAPGVDGEGYFICAAGETNEPDLTKRNGKIRKALEEEMVGQIPSIVYLYYGGEFSVEDSRYTSYTLEDDGQIITFGSANRGQSTELFIAIVPNEDNTIDFDNIIPGTDAHEIQPNTSYWIEPHLYKEKPWFPGHAKFAPLAASIVQQIKVGTLIFAALERLL